MVVFCVSARSEIKNADPQDTYFHRVLRLSPHSVSKLISTPIMRIHIESETEFRNGPNRFAWFFGDITARTA